MTLFEQAPAIRGSAEGPSVEVRPPPSRGPNGDIPIPKYFRVKEALRARIADGTLRPGEPLPSEPEACKEFGVSRITVRRAVSDLVHEGTLRTVQGKGTFVVERKVPERFVHRAFGLYEDMQRRGLTLTTRILRQGLVPAPAHIADRLRIPCHEPVYLLERVRSVEGEILMLSTSYIPHGLCPGLETEYRASDSLYRLLRERYGLRIARGQRDLEAVAAGEREARLLALALASPLLLLDTVTYLADGRPMEYSRVWQRGDRVRVEVVFLPTTDEA